jgi:hypothetical protein
MFLLLSSIVLPDMQCCTSVSPMLYFQISLSYTYVVHLYFADDADFVNLPIKLPDAVEMLYDRVIRVKEKDDIAYVHFLELLYIFNLMFLHCFFLMYHVVY